MRTAASLTSAFGPRASAARRPALFAAASEGPWLFGRRTDLLAFGGSAALSVALLAVGYALGIADGDAPEWVWLGCVLGVDIAHVWTTLFRTYLDRDALRRDPALYAGVPVLCYTLGVALHAYSAAAFWRVLAYAAVYHFVRQQYGWVKLYRRRAGETGRLDRVLDTTTIHAATVYPLLYWHAHLPRAFAWMIDGDFVAALPRAFTIAVDALQPLYWTVLGAFVLRQVTLLLTGRAINTGKVLVVLTTWLCWWLGIIALDSDYAFTVTNVLIHGVPYFVLTYRYGRSRAARTDRGALRLLLRGSVPAFVGLVLALAALEAGLWDHWVWHDRPYLFGDGPSLAGGALALLVPLLAVPQATHYVLDGFIWRRKALSDG